MMLEKSDMELLIEAERAPDKSLAVLICGIADSGKTTFSQKMEEYGYIRLSIDEEVWSANG